MKYYKTLVMQRVMRYKKAKNNKEKTKALRKNSKPFTPKYYYKTTGIVLFGNHNKEPYTIFLYKKYVSELYRSKLDYLIVADSKSEEFVYVKGKN